MLPSPSLPFVGAGLYCDFSWTWFPVSRDPRVALSFSSPGYELFAEADAQGLTVSTERQRYKINTPHKTSQAARADRMNKGHLVFTLIFSQQGNEEFTQRLLF